MLSNNSTVVVAPHQISSALADASVILNLDSSIYYGLDAVGARIWNLVQQPRTVTEICNVVVEEYDVDPARAARDVHALLQKLSEAGLIEIKNANG